MEFIRYIFSEYCKNPKMKKLNTSDKINIKNKINFASIFHFRKNIEIVKIRKVKKSISIKLITSPPLANN